MLMSMSRKAGVFNLIDEAWIPILRLDGTYERIGVMEALTQAHRIQSIAASSPMDRLAVVRFLLAVLYWCKGNPPARDPANYQPGFPEAWFRKLTEHREAFNLFGAGRRFYQEKAENESRLSANYLVHEIPTGTNLWHFRHSTDLKDGLCPPCCAMGLLRLPVFSTAGGCGKPPGINSKPPLYVVPVGQTLEATLRLSWKPVQALGEPAWINTAATIDKRSSVPVLVGLTWLPRRVWLEEPSEPEAACISCGEYAPLVRGCVFAGKESLRRSGEGVLWRDPHVVYVQGKTAGEPLKTRNAIESSVAGCGDWAPTLAEILKGWCARDAGPSQGDVLTPRKLWTVGFATTKNDKYIEASEAYLPVAGFDTARLDEITAALESWEGAQRKLENILRRREKAAKNHADKHTRGAVLRPLLDAARADLEVTASTALTRSASGSVDLTGSVQSLAKSLIEALAGSFSPGVTCAQKKQHSEFLREVMDAMTIHPTGSGRRLKSR